MYIHEVVWGPCVLWPVSIKYNRFQLYACVAVFVNRNLVVLDKNALTALCGKVICLLCCPEIHFHYGL